MKTATTSILVVFVAAYRCCKAAAILSVRHTAGPS